MWVAGCIEGGVNQERVGGHHNDLIQMEGRWDFQSWTINECATNLSHRGAHATSEYHEGVLCRNVPRVVQ